jgi:hypothetical protein
MEGKLSEKCKVACEYGASGNEMQTMLMRGVVGEWISAPHHLIALVCNFPFQYTLIPGG